MMAIRSENIHLPLLKALLPQSLSAVIAKIDDGMNAFCVSVGGLSIDSRAIKNGDVFVALQGVSVHGEVFIPAAINQGAVAILCSSSKGDIRVEYCDAIPVIFIPALETYLSEIAGNFYQHPTKKLPVVGITGTNGKTSCAQIYAQISAFNECTVGVIGTMGYGACRPSSSNINDTIRPGYSLSLVSTGMTTPDAITMQSVCDELLSCTRSGNGLSLESLVMEVSSHGLEQGRVAAIDINTAVFTNLTHDHLDYHGNMAAYGDAKAKLFQMSSLRMAVINLDDDFSGELLKKVAPEVTVVSYSVSHSEADLYLRNIRYGNSQLLADLHFKNEVYALSTPLVGRFNLSNLLAVLAVFSEQENFAQIVAASQYLQPISGRMESVKSCSGVQVVVDFAHTPDALDNVLQAVNDYVDGEIYCVFGCGGDRDQSKRPLMAAIAERHAHHVVVTSDNPRTEDALDIIRQVEQGFSKNNHHVVVDRESAIQFAIKQAKVGDMVVVAGKGHEAYQLIGDQKLSFSDQKIASAALKVKDRSDDISSNASVNESVSKDARKNKSDGAAL